MPSDGVYRRSRVIGEREIDELGHVNNVVWVRLVMELAGAHSQSVGLSMDAYRAMGGIFVVRQHVLDYLQPAFPGDEVEGETWIGDIRGARCVRHVRFTRVRDDARLLESVTQWAFVDFGTGRPRRIPPQVLAAFPTVERDPAGGPRPDRAVGGDQARSSAPERRFEPPRRDLRHAHDRGRRPQSDPEGG